MKKSPICQNCHWYREPGPVDIDIPGQGNWCSNSESPNYRSRVAAKDGCDEFTQRGKKAPIKMRIAVKAMGTVNKALTEFSEKRHSKRKRK